MSRRDTGNVRSDGWINSSSNTRISVSNQERLESRSRSRCERIYFQNDHRHFLREVGRTIRLARLFCHSCRFIIYVCDRVERLGGVRASVGEHRNDPVASRGTRQTIFKWRRQCWWHSTGLISRGDSVDSGLLVAHQSYGRSSHQSHRDTARVVHAEKRPGYSVALR